MFSLFWVGLAMNVSETIQTVNYIIVNGALGRVFMYDWLIYSFLLSLFKLWYNNRRIGHPVRIEAINYGLLI